MPSASPKAKAPIVPVTVSRCPSCGSTDRLAYNCTTEQEYTGGTPEGKPCTHVVRKWTSCKQCGQRRVDRSYENRVAGNNN